MSLIIKEDMNRQISEMWDAVYNIPVYEPDRDFAITQAQETECKLRRDYLKQEQLRNAAPEMLKMLNDCQLKFDLIALDLEAGRPSVHDSSAIKYLAEKIRKLIKEIES